jgi:hypothetical protein
MDPKRKTAALTKAKIDELSLVFKTDPQTGAEFAPRNGMATVLSVKGAPAGAFLAKAVEAVKGYFAPGWTPGEYPVTTAADDIDNDGDGPSDYNQIFSAIAGVYNDISSCYWIQDDDARSIAIKTAIDGFLTELDQFRGGSTKAGARHSKEDAAHIKAIGDKLDEAKAHVASLLPVDPAGETQADKDEAKNDKGDGEGEDGAGDEKSGPVHPTLSFAPNGLPDFITAEFAKSEEIAIVESVIFENKAKAKDDKKPYGDVEYADPENGKYPIDTKEHAKAAWSYINKEKNADEYSAADLKKVKDKIKAACEKFDIEISDDKASPVTETVSISVDAGAAALEAITSALATFKADITAQLAAHTESVNGRIDEVLKPVTEELTTRTEEVSTLKASVDAMATSHARKSGAPGGQGFISPDGEQTGNGFVTVETVAPALGPNATVADVVRAGRAQT